jgi:hypothetical protein
LIVMLHLKRAMRNALLGSPFRKCAAVLLFPLQC